MLENRIPLSKRAQYEKLQEIKNVVLSLKEMSDELFLRFVAVNHTLLDGILKRYHFEYVGFFAGDGGAEILKQRLFAYSSEILFAIASEMSTLDLGSKHLLMSKKVSEMTGYEYKRYLEILGAPEG